MLEWNCWRDWGGHSGREEREIEKEVREGGRTSRVRMKSEGHPRGVRTLADPVQPGILDQTLSWPGCGTELSMLTNARAVE